uniref:Retrovirus-related Pol polyprotein from transposon TNT 1-94 n=1 Tax=Tanacetum cinerariifolium TaxID=118510 RepID=A0A6L2KWY0_TANCI|nr:retrovirus-related Pol polyprotein from transposon TNT 1-94 [Tanacetum cinerariifolium]
MTNILRIQRQQQWWRVVVIDGGVSGFWIKGCEALFTKNTYSNGSKRIRGLRVRVCEMREPKKIYLGVELEPDEWIKENGCSKYMTGNLKLFSTYKAHNGCNVIFGSNLRGNVIGKGKICDNKCRVTFSEHDSEITKDGKVIGRSIRKKGLYVMKLGNKPKDQICLATIDKSSTLWHRILGHANMRLIQSLASKELVRNLPKLKFDQHFCVACKIGKQAHASHKAKNIVSMTRCLELLHMDLFGLSAVQSYGENCYTLVIVDDYSRKVEESLNVTFDETLPPSKTSPLVDDDLDDEEAIKVTEIVNIKESKHKNVNEALADESWIVAMQKELNQFIANNVWELVSQPRNMTIIGTKWVFRNKLDENSIVYRNKARLVAKGYNQQEGIDYDETNALVARLESISILLAYAYALDFKLFQMDVKSAFLNGFINEEVYVAQPLGFIDFEKPNHVYKLKKVLYGLKQAPKSWYDRLKAFLIKHEYKMEMVDNTLFTKKKSSNLIIIQIYVDDIIFGSTCQDMCDGFSKIMHDEFKMSMMGELNFFLGLQIKQMEDVYADSDHAGDYVDRKSTIGICTFVGCYLTSWFLKKQTALAISTTKAEYVTAEKACQQSLWMKQTFIDYDIRLDDILIMCDNKDAINLSKNPVQHSRTKHIKIRHHFLRDNVQKGHISIEKVPSVENIADILMNPLKLESFNYLRLGLGMMEHISQIGACVFTDKRSLDELAYGVSTDGPYQTNPPSPNDIVSSIRIDREGQVRHIHHEKEIDVHEYQILTREIGLEAFGRNYPGKHFLFGERKTRKDRGTRRGRPSTSFSSAFDHPSSSHLNDDDDDDGNEEGTSRASTPSPIRFVNSLANEVPQVFQNPPNIDPHLEPFYTPSSSDLR